MRQMSRRGRAVTLACFVIGGGLLTGAPSGAEGVGWISVLAATLAGMVVAGALSRLGGAAGGSDFFAALEKRLGKLLSAIVTVVLAAAAAGLLLRDISVTAKFVGANMIAETPELIVALSFAAVAAWCAASGRSAVGRWAELTGLIALVVLAAALALAARDFSPDAVMDGLREGTGDILPGAVGIFAECFGSAVIASAALFPFGPGERRRALPLAVGIGIGGATLAVVYLMNVALLGGETMELFNFPTYHALRVSGVDGVLERMEALLMLPAVVFGLLRAAVEILFLAGAVGRFFRGAERRKLSYFVIAAAASALTFAIFPSQIELRERTEALLGVYAALWAAFAALAAICATRRGQ